MKLDRKAIGDALARLRARGTRTSLFIDPAEDAVRASADLGAEAVELHTGEYANAPLGPGGREVQLGRLAAAAQLARELELDVHAGHGLTYENVTPVAALADLEELNIGHSIVSRAVREMAEVIRRARQR